MQTSLQGIAKKAKERKEYRFGNLYTMLNKENLADSFQFLNSKSAPGYDRKTVKEYEEKLSENLDNLVDRLKQKNYKAKLVMRVNIPKGNGKMRPLGLPVVEDKLLQITVTRILSAIYEQDFLPCSFGYRPNVGPTEAGKELSGALNFGKYNYVVEADIKGFFDSIDHDLLVKMLELRINDNALIRLIKKWLKAGVLDTDGKILHPVTGTPQGGVISPILANIYLHYALDLWFEEVIKPQSNGEAYLCRYADDFVCAFQNKTDAEKFYMELPKNLEKFSLELASEKTRIIRFSRFDDKDDNNSFDFLGFEYRWSLSRNGKKYIQRTTSRKKFKNSLKNFTDWCRENRHQNLNKIFDQLNAKLRGYNNYYGVIGNYKKLSNFYHHAQKILFNWLNRRSQRRSFKWSEFYKICKLYGMEKPRITEKRDCQLKFNFT